MVEFKAGDIILGRYQVQGLLGKGAESCAYLVQDKGELDRRLTLKVVPELSPPPEFHLLRSMNHPHIGAMYDFVTIPDSEVGILICEYIQGKELGNWIIEELSLDSLFEVFAQICRALQYLHVRGIIHYDIKPSNIIVNTTQGVLAKLVDFGLAQPRSRAGFQGLRGTLAYMAPEVIKGEDIDHRADMYSLGATFYHVLSGKPPFGDIPDLYEALCLRVECEPVPLDQLRKDICPAFRSVIKRLLAREPAGRFPEANEAIRTLSRSLGRNYQLEPHQLRAQFFIPSFVDRGHELGVIREALQNKKCVCISGPSGIGKTRLLEELRFQLQKERHQVLYWNCGHAKLGPFQSLVTLVQQLWRMHAGSKSLQRYAPLLAKWIPGIPINSPYQYSYEQQIQGLVDLLVDAAYKCPYILIVDDLHLADQAGIELCILLLQVLQDKRGLPLSILISFTEEELPDQFKERLFRMTEVCHITLNELGIQEIVQLLRSMHLGDEDAQILAQESIRKGGGNPYWIREAIYTLAGQGILTWEEGKWHLDRQRLLGTELIIKPKEMQSYVLTPYQQEILEWLAVYGGPMPEGILFTILPCQRIADLVTLQRKGWLQRIESKGWAFKHSTKRGQIYENIPEETRAIMHREIAQLLEERADKDEEGQIIEEIASHYIRTQPCDRGKEVVSRAAQKAFREGFYPFALNLYQKLLTWLEDQDPMFIDTLLRTAASAKEAGQFSEATKHYKRLEVLCDRLEAPQKVEYLLGVMDMYGKQNQWDRVKPLAEEILGLYQRGLCTPVQALEAAEHMVSYGNFTGVSKDVINLWCNRALDLAKQASDPVRTAGWLLHTLDSRTDLKDIESARVIRQVTHATEEGLKIVDKSNDLHMRSLFYTDAAVGLMAMIGDFTRARECAQKALELAESIWSYSGSSFALTTLARIEMMMGELSASEERLKASLRAAERSREAWRLIYAKLHWMQLLLFQDRYKELLSYDYTPLNLDQPRHLGDYAAKLRRARVYLYLGDYKKAMDETSECRRLLEERIVIGGASIFWETLIEIYQEIGQLDDAEKLCHQAIQYFQATCFRRQVGDFMLLLAKTKFLQGRIEEGLDIIQRPPPAGRDIHRILSAHLLECRLWLSKGVRSKAREALTEAKEATERLSRRSAIAEVCWLEGELALQDPDADLWGIARKIQEALNLVDQIGLPGLKWRLLATQGRIYLKMRDLERAFESLRGAIQILARLRHRLPGKEYRQSYISSNRGDIVIKDLKEIRKELISMKQALGDDFSVLAILELVKRLNAQVNLDKLLSEIMDTALNISGAERGLLILVEDGEFRFPVTRSTNGGDLTGDQLAVSTSIAHRVIQSGQAILTIDALQEHQWQSFQSVQELGIRSVLCLPFKIRDQVIGVLYLDHRLKEGVFSERTKKMLEILCDQMAIAIEQARLRRQEEITWTLIKHMLAPEREAEEGLEALLDGIIKFTHAQRGMVLVFDPEGRPFVVAQRQTTHGDPQQISTRIINKAITTGKVLVMQDVLGDPEIGGYESVREIGIRSLICVPILLAKGFTGAIYLDDLRELKRFSSSTTWLIQLAKELIDPLNLLVETRLRGLELKQTRQDVNALIKQLRQNYDFGNIVARSPSMTQILRQTIQVAKTNVPVLLQGETGVGKELIARAIHYNSPRVTHPFVTIHCSALPPSLLESELFGHEKGAFTGAIQMRKGRLEVAENGTVFLDEISELSLELQAKLLRVLQFGELQRVGSDQTHRIDVRFVTASNKPLEDLVQQGRFREDLLYRLNVVTLTLPPLRERREDIPLLIEHFLQKFSEDLGRKLELQGAAREWLLHYDYPGNVRELENLILRGAILSEYGKIGIEHLVFRRIPEPIYHERLTHRMKLDPMEIRRILKKTHGNVTQSARDLGLTRQHLYRLLLKYNIKVQDYRV